MPYLKSLPDNAVLLDVFRSFPDLWRPMIEYHEVLMRGSSSLLVGERELVAAYVSGLNQCHYCHGVHAATARRLGVDQTLLADLLEDLETAGASDRLRAVLRYVKRLTLTPAQITPEDAEAVYAAGLDEEAFHRAVSICALFNFMNRMVEGLGIQAAEDYFQTAAERLSSGGYEELLKLLDPPSAS